MSTDLPMWAISERKLSLGRSATGRGAADEEATVEGVIAGVAGPGAGFSSGRAFHILPPRWGHRHYTATFGRGKVLSPLPRCSPVLRRDCRPTGGIGRLKDGTVGQLISTPSETRPQRELHLNHECPIVTN